MIPEDESFGCQTQLIWTWFIGFGRRIVVVLVAMIIKFLLTLILTLSFTAEAAKKKSSKRKSYKGYKITRIPKMKLEDPLFTSRDFNKILPSQIDQNESDEKNLKRIGDRAFQVWMKSGTMQKLSVVQAAQKVESAMKAEVKIGGNDPSQVQHKVNFQVQALQATSKVDYKGYVDASVTYNLKDQVSAVELREKIMKDKDLYVNHSSSKSENLSSVGMKWSF